MKINEMLDRADNGEVVIVDAHAQTISDRQKGDNFDTLYNWLEDEPGEIFENGKLWSNRSRVPLELRKGDLVIQNDEPSGIVWIFNASRRN